MFGPLIDTCIKACNKSFLILLKSQVILFFTAEAPLSGLDFKIGRDKQISAICSGEPFPYTSHSYFKLYLLAAI